MNKIRQVFPTRSAQFCPRCRKLLGLDMRPDAVFCSPTCGATWNRVSRKIRHRFPILKKLEGLLKRSRATYFRLETYTQEAIYSYPARGRKTCRFDRVERDTPGFQIRPFEFPVVPKEAQYRVLYLDEQGSDLPDGSKTVLVIAGPVFVVDPEYGDMRRFK